MANFYVYLIASLPTLHFGTKPFINFEKFLELCCGIIPDDEVEILRNLPEAASYDSQYQGSQEALKKWYSFENVLRNELVKIRAARKKIDSLKYIRNETYAGPEIAHVALAAHRNPSLLEGERILDEERWKYLDELCLGHYFDFDFLVIYAQKLLILERWEKIRDQDKYKLLEDVLKIA